MAMFKKLIYITLLLFSPLLALKADEFDTDTSKTFLFDGIDDIILIPDSEVIRPKSMTVQLDFKLNEGISLKSGNNKTRQFILFKKNPLQHFNEGIAIYYDETGQNIIATVSDVNRKQVFAYSPKNSIEKNKWYSITVSADSIDVRMYLDTTLLKANPTGFNLVFDKEPLLIGGRNNVKLEMEKYGGMLNGELKNIKIFNKSVTEMGENLFFQTPQMLDSFVIVNYEKYEQSSIALDKSGKNNGIILKGKPTKQEIKEPDYVRVNPNPVKYKGEVFFNMFSKSNVKVLIRDLNGNEVLEVHNGALNKGEQRLSFDAQNINSGYYICFIENDSTVRSASLIVTK